MIPVLLVALSLGHPAPKTVTRSDSGKTVTIAPHQLLRIKLAECDDCGFTWKTTVKPDPAVLSGRRTIRTPPACSKQPTPCVGGNATVRFRYVGGAAGLTKLRLGYFGPGAMKASKSFRLTVRVR